VASRPSIKDLPLSNKLKTILCKLGIEDLVDLNNTTPQELIAYGLTQCDINTIATVLPQNALLCQCMSGCQCVVASSKESLKFASHSQALQLLSNLLQKKVKIAVQPPLDDTVDFIKNTITKFEETEDWDVKQNVIDDLFVGRFGMGKKFGIDKYSFNAEKMVVGILDELIKVWKNYESQNKRVDLLNKAIDSTYKYGSKLGYEIGSRPAPSSHGIMQLPQKQNEFSKAASKEKK